MTTNLFKLAGKTPSNQIDVNVFTKKVFDRLRSEKKDKRRTPKISNEDMLNSLLDKQKR